MKNIKSISARYVVVSLTLISGLLGGMNASAQTSVSCVVKGPSSATNNTCTSGPITVAPRQFYLLTGVVKKQVTLSAPRAVFQSVRVGIGFLGEKVVHSAPSYGTYSVRLTNDQLIKRRYKARITKWSASRPGDNATVSVALTR